MTLPQEPFQVDLTDFRFTAYGSSWCLSVEFDDQTQEYLPVLWKLDGISWIVQSYFHTHDVATADELRTKFGSPANYLKTLCDAVNAFFIEKLTVPLPTPGDALSRSLYHAKVSLTWDGGKLSSPAELYP
jgi:hypothetical protein